MGIVFRQCRFGGPSRLRQKMRPGSSFQGRERIGKGKGSALRIFGRRSSYGSGGVRPSGPREAPQIWEEVHLLIRFILLRVRNPQFPPVVNCNIAFSSSDKKSSPCCPSAPFLIIESRVRQFAVQRCRRRSSASRVEGVFVLGSQCRHRHDLR